MNKKIFFLVFIQVCLLATKSFAQYPISNPCGANPNTTGCILDQHVNGSASWFCSHGGLSFSNNNAPTSPPGTQSLVLWSFLNTSNGAFTCYNFVQGNTYRVCFWVRNNSGWPSNPFGRLYVSAAKNLNDYGPSGSTTLPSVTTQPIDDTYYGPPQQLADYPTGEHKWEFISATFTANANYSSLWFYALNPMGTPPPGPAQYNTTYVVEVDDIRVEDITTTPSPTITGVTGNSTISGCNNPAGPGQTTLTIGMPSSYKAIWTPAVSTANPTGKTVIAAPCSTTTYKVEVYDPAASCGTCVREVLSYTVNVNQWSNPARIISPTAPVPCTTPLMLDYNDPLTCTGVSYTWISPHDTPYYGKLQNIPANAYHTGEWTLQIWMPGKSCAEEHKFNVTVGSCCVSSPNFTFTPGANPVSFTNTGTGIINHVSTLWNFGDGTTSDLDNPIHTYTAAGTYTVCLTTLYEDGQGESCCDRKCQLITVPANTNTCMVNVDFTYAPVLGWSHAADFTDASSGNGTICKYEWDFNDGSPIVTTTLPTVRHAFTAGSPSPRWVCLTATNCVYDVHGALIAQCSTTKCITIPDLMVAKPDASNAAQKGIPQTGAHSAASPIDEPVADRVLLVYPNPNSGNFALSLGKRTGSYTVVVRDKLGREVYNREHVFSNAPVKIMLNDISSGVYSIEVINNKEKFVQQISITR